MIRIQRNYTSSFCMLNGMQFLESMCKCGVDKKYVKINDSVYLSEVVKLSA